MILKHFWIIILLYTNYCAAQKIKLKDLQGVWVSALDDVDYRVFINDSLIGLGFYKSGDVLIYSDKIGFVDVNNQDLINAYRKEFNLNLTDADHITNFDVPENLKLEILNQQKNEKDYFYHGGSIWGLGIDLEDLPSKIGSRFELINSNVFVYIKVAQLPNNYMNALYKKGKKDKKNYLKNFFNMEFKEIKSTKSTLYKTPNIPTKMYLIRGNEVEVLEQKDNWIRIRYYGKKTIEGWVKKEDVE